MSAILEQPQADQRRPDWFSELIGPQAAEVFTRYAVPCLHYAHWAALYRFRLDDWTDETTYGTDRYRCFAAQLSRVVNDRLPGAKAHRPNETFGTPFTIESGRWLIYTYRYGKTARDRFQGISFKEDSGIRSKIASRHHDGQGQLDYEGLPPIPLSSVIFLAWAGNRDDGLCRAFLAMPYISVADGLLYWHEDKFLELDVGTGRSLYGLPVLPDTPDAPGAPLPAGADAERAEVPKPPAFDLELIDEGAA
jgi:hypothetical protein